MAVSFALLSLLLTPPGNAINLQILLLFPHSRGFCTVVTREFLLCYLINNSSPILLSQFMKPHYYFRITVIWKLTRWGWTLLWMNWKLWKLEVKKYRMNYIMNWEILNDIRVSNLALCHEGTWGSGGRGPRILNPFTLRKWVVVFTPQPIFPQGNITRCPLDRRGGKKSLSMLGIELLVMARHRRGPGSIPGLSV
jgi:hypothetical protein